MISTLQRHIHQTSATLCLEESFTDCPIKALTILPHRLVRIKGPLKICRISRLVAIYRPVARQQFFLPLTREIVKVSFHYAQWRKIKIAHMLSPLSLTIITAVAFGPYLCRHHMTFVCCCQTISTLRHSVTDTDRDIITIPSDRRLISKAVELEIIVKLQRGKARNTGGFPQYRWWQLRRIDFHHTYSAGLTRKSHHRDFTNVINQVTRQTHDNRITLSRTHSSNQMIRRTNHPLNLLSIGECLQVKRIFPTNLHLCLMTADPYIRRNSLLFGVEIGQNDGILYLLMTNDIRFSIQCEILLITTKPLLRIGCPTNIETI